MSMETLVQKHSQSVEELKKHFEDQVAQLEARLSARVMPGTRAQADASLPKEDAQESVRERRNGGWEAEAESLGLESAGSYSHGNCRIVGRGTLRASARSKGAEARSLRLLRLLPELEQGSFATSKRDQRPAMDVDEGGKGRGQSGKGTTRSPKKQRSVSPAREVVGAAADPARHTPGAEGRRKSSLRGREGDTHAVGRRRSYSQILTSMGAAIVSKLEQLKGEELSVDSLKREEQSAGTDLHWLQPGMEGWGEENTGEGKREHLSLQLSPSKTSTKRNSVPPHGSSNDVILLHPQSSGAEGISPGRALTEQDESKYLEWYEQRVASTRSKGGFVAIFY